VADYYGHVRTEIADLLPPKAASILEIGSAAGGTLKWIAARYPGARTTGVEGLAENLPQLQQNADEAYIADLDTGLPDQLGRYDLILALDVLEHLKEPDSVLQRLVANHLAPDGSIIVSLPAVSHYSVSLPLLLRRRFDYADEGILDRTHLHFFVESSCVALMNRSGLVVSDGCLGGFFGSKTRLADLLTFGLLRHWLAKQYIMRGVLAAGPQTRINWKIARAL
jgi:SAM-dependent methyltransferase